MDEIKNIIFDFDGTLADTSKLIVATMQKSIQDYGLPFRTCGVSYGNGKALELEEADANYVISEFSRLTNIIKC